MKNQGLLFVVTICLVVTIILFGCNDSSSLFSVNHEIVDVGLTNVGDSARAQLIIHNNSKERISISFLPECDCTTVDTDILTLNSRESGTIEVKVLVDNYGDFTKYVFAQALGQDNFMTITIKGSTN